MHSKLNIQGNISKNQFIKSIVDVIGHQLQLHRT